MKKSDDLKSKGRILINGEPLNESNRKQAALAVTDGFIRAAYSMRDTGELSDRLNDMLHQWSYTSLVTGETYGK